MKLLVEGQDFPHFFPVDPEICLDDHLLTIHMHTVVPLRQGYSDAVSLTAHPDFQTKMVGSQTACLEKLLFIFTHLIPLGIKEVWHIALNNVLPFRMLFEGG
jgi:hypothetical protein